jgi:phage N-6-adenine-methyltransferase
MMLERARASRRRPSNDLSLPSRLGRGRVSADQDAAAIGELYRKAKTSILDSIRYCVECGERLKAKQDSLLHGAWLPWLRDNADVLGFGSRFTAAKLMRLAANVPSTAHLDEASAVALSRDLWGNNAPMRGTGNNEWYTPRRYIEAARKVLGEIDLDPASCKEAQKVVRARKFFTIETNGLDKEWHGRVWLNPPYSRGLAPAFVNKLVAEIDAGRTVAAIMLSNSCTDTHWFDVAMRAVASMCFTYGRIDFQAPEVRPDARTQQGPQGQAFSYFGNEPQRFEDVFCEIGGCWRPSRMFARAAPSNTGIAVSRGTAR